VDENGKLKWLLAGAMLDNIVLKDLLGNHPIGLRVQARDALPGDGILDVVQPVPDLPASFAKPSM